MFSARFGLCHFADYIETTHLRYKIAIVILRFHFDFYFSVLGCLQRTAFVALFFCLLFDGYSLLSRRFDIYLFI